MIKKASPVLVLMLLCLVILFLGSCTAERKLAHEFYRNRQNTAVLIIPTNFVYKQNLKAWEASDAGWMEQNVLDSVLFYKSDYLQFVSDSIFLESYMNHLIEGLRSKGLKVYLQDDTDLFLENTRDRFIVNVAQLLLEENVELLFDPEVDLEHAYIGDFYLNTVTLSSWFEISGLNEPEPATAVAFSEITLRDHFDGRLRFFPFSGRVVYAYTVDSIEVDDVYYLGTVAGTRYASYLFDYFLNRSIDRNLPPNETRTTYYRYDFTTRMLKHALDEKFIFIE